MKKLLNILNITTLIGTISTTIVACNDPAVQPQPRPEPEPTIEKIDISKKIPDKPINLEQLSANTATAFLEKLQLKLTNIADDLASINTTDYDVYKKDTTTTIKDSDIQAGNSLQIKIVAKGSKFAGTKDNITVIYLPKDTRIDLKKIITHKNLENIIISKLTPDKLELLRAIQNKNDAANELTVNDINIKKYIDTTQIIITGKNNYKGEVTLSYQRETNIKKYISFTQLDNVYFGQEMQPTIKAIKIAIKERIKFEFNSKLDLTKIQIDNITNHDVIIKSNDNNFYTGEVKLEFFSWSSFKQINGAQDNDNIFTTDLHGNIYMVANDTVYKCPAAQTDFIAMTGITFDTTTIDYGIHGLITDNAGNIYVGASGTGATHYMYKCLAGQNNFVAMTGLDTLQGYGVHNLTIDKNGNIYMSDFQNLYKCLAGQNNFNLVTKISEIYNLKTDSQGNIYVATYLNNGGIYKCLAGESNFQRLTNFSGETDNLIIDNNDNILVKQFSDKQIYKCLAGESNFKKIGDSTKKIISWAVDSQGNIYASFNNSSNLYSELYKLEKEKWKKIAIFPSTPGYNQIHKILIDKENNIFVETKNENGFWAIFKCQDTIDTFHKFELYIKSDNPFNFITLCPDDMLYIKIDGFLLQSEKHLI